MRNLGLAEGLTKQGTGRACTKIRPPDVPMSLHTAETHDYL